MEKEMTHITLSFFFFNFIHLFDRESKRAQTGGAADTLLSREPDAGLHPGTLRL